MLLQIVNAITAGLRIIVIPDWRAVRLEEERHLKRLFEYLRVDCVFDVGANVGQYGSMLRKYVGYRGRIISFEPNPVAAKHLEDVASRDAQWTVECIALGGTEGMANFQVYDRSELSSFLSFSASRHAPTNMKSKTISVPVRTLASYMKDAKLRWGFKRPFLKLDTQGADLDIARSAGNAFDDFVGVQSEIAFQTIYERAPDYRTALDFYHSAGFVISRLVPIHEIHFPQLVEMDAIFVRVDLSNPSKTRL